MAAEPAERGIVQRPPRAPKESLFAHGMWQHILFVGLLIGALCLAVQAWAVVTIAAVALTIALQLATVYIPWLQPVFRTVPLSGVELGVCLVAAFVVLLAVEAEKAWRRPGVPLPRSRG